MFAYLPQNEKSHEVNGHYVIAVTTPRFIQSKIILTFFKVTQQLATTLRMYTWVHCRSPSRSRRSRRWCCCGGCDLATWGLSLTFPPQKKRCLVLTTGKVKNGLCHYASWYVGEGCLKKAVLQTDNGLYQVKDFFKILENWTYWWSSSTFAMLRLNCEIEWSLNCLISYNLPSYPSS